MAKHMKINCVYACERDWCLESLIPLTFGLLPPPNSNYMHVFKLLTCMESSESNKTWSASYTQPGALSTESLYTWIWSYPRLSGKFNTTHTNKYSFDRGFLAHINAFRQYYYNVLLQRATGDSSRNRVTLQTSRRSAKLVCLRLLS